MFPARSAIANRIKGLAAKVNPEEGEAKRKVRSKTQELTYYTEILDSKKWKQKYYNVYQQGDIIAEAIDKIALDVISDSPTIEAEEKDEARTLQDWWDASHGFLFLFNAVRWALVFGESAHEKVRNRKGETTRLTYIDGRSCEYHSDDRGHLTKMIQKFDMADYDPATFDPSEIVIVNFFTKPESDYEGISLIERNWDNIQRKAMVDEGTSYAVHRHGFPKYHIRVSPLQEGLPVPEPTLDEYEKVFQDINSQNEFVTDDKVEIVGIDDAASIKAKEYVEWSITLLTGGLGVPEEELGLGRGSTEATAKVRKATYERKIKAMRLMLSEQVETQLLSEVKEQLGIKGGAWLNYGEISPESEAKVTERVFQLRSLPKPVITIKEAREMLNLPAEMEEEEAREEQPEGGLFSFVKGYQKPKGSPAPQKKRPEDERDELTDKYQMPLRGTENRLIAELTLALQKIEEGLIKQSEKLTSKENRAARKFQEPPGVLLKLDISKKDRGEFKKILDRTLEDSFAVGVNETYDVLGLGETPGLSDPEAIQWLEMQSAAISDNLLDDSINKMRFELIEGVRAGEGTARLRDRMSTVFDGTRDELDRIARTEIQRAANEGRLSGYEQNGITKVEYLVTSDGRTCQHCLAFDGKQMTIEEARNLIPLHPQCRCTYIPVTGVNQ